MICSQQQQQQHKFFFTCNEKNNNDDKIVQIKHVLKGRRLVCIVLFQRRLIVDGYHFPCPLFIIRSTSSRIFLKVDSSLEGIYGIICT